MPFFCSLGCLQNFIMHSEENCCRDFYPQASGFSRDVLTLLFLAWKLAYFPAEIHHFSVNCLCLGCPASSEDSTSLHTQPPQVKLSHSWIQLQHFYAYFSHGLPSYLCMNRFTLFPFLEEKPVGVHKFLILGAKYSRMNENLFKIEIGWSFKSIDKKQAFHVTKKSNFSKNIFCDRMSL